MSVIEFAYTKYRDMMVPMIPVKMKGQDRWFEFWAFVDSGATYSIFASKEAEGLGIEIKQDDLVKSQKWDGKVKRSKCKARKS